MKPLHLILGTVLMAIAPVHAKIELPSIIGDNMVLQQQTHAAVWGKATPNSTITITTSWTKEKFKTKSNQNGKWLTRITTPKAGGPYSITFSDGEAMTINNVLIGEVWYCGGQSNMEMPVMGNAAQLVEHSAATIANAKASQPIRMATVKHRISYEEEEWSEGNWQENTPEVVAKTSACAYFFAQQLQKTLNVPVGILVCVWGSTMIEHWMDKETLKQALPKTDLAFLQEKKPTNSPLATTLYNGMMAPLQPFTFKGMIWYQGESNISNFQDYTALQPAYVEMMRKKFENPDAGFYFVQIAPFRYGGAEKVSGTGGMKWVQAQTLALIPHSGMATTNDIGNAYCIHPHKKKDLGERLAYLALSHDYGMKNILADPPIADTFTFKDGKVRVTFKNAERGLCPTGTDIGELEVCGEDKVWYPAVGRIERGPSGVPNELEVKCKEVKNPIAVRYAMKNCSGSTITNSMEIPASPFRSDDWPL